MRQADRPTVIINDGSWRENYLTPLVSTPQLTVPTPAYNKIQVDCSIGEQGMLPRRIGSLFSSCPLCWCQSKQFMDRWVIFCLTQNRRRPLCEPRSYTLGDSRSYRTHLSTCYDSVRKNKGYNKTERLTSSMLACMNLLVSRPSQTNSMEKSPSLTMSRPL